MAVQVADDAEVVQAQAPVGHHEGIARVRIAMEEADAEQLLQIGVEQKSGQALAVVGAVRAGDRTPYAERLHQHVLVYQRLDHGRHVHAGNRGEHALHAAHVGGLDAEVDLAPQLRGDLVDEVEWTPVRERWPQ